MNTPEQVQQAQLAQLAPETSKLIDFSILIMMLLSSFVIAGTLTRLNIQFFELGPKLCFPADIFLVYIGKISTFLITIPMFAYGTFLMIRKQKELQSITFLGESVLRLFSRILKSFPIIIIIISTLSVLYDADIYNGNLQPNLLGMLLSIYIIDNIGIPAFWFSSFIIISLVMIYLTNNLRYVKPFGKDIVILFFMILMALSFFSSQLGWDIVPGLDEPFHNNLGISVYENLKNLVATRTGNSAVVFSFFIFSWTITLLFLLVMVAKRQVFFLVTQGILLVIENIPDDVKKKLSQTQLDLIGKLMKYLRQTPSRLMPKPQVKLVSNINPINTKVDAELNDCKDVIPSEKLASVREKKLQHVQQLYQTAKQQPLPKVKELPKPKTQCPIKTTNNPALNIAKQILEAVNDEIPSWQDNVFRIDGPNCTSGMLHWIIPTQMKNGNSIETLENPRNLRHLGDILTRNFWANNEIPIAPKDENFCNISISVASHRGQGMFIVDKNFPDRKWINFIEYNEQYGIQQTLQELDGYPYFVGCDIHGKKVFRDIYHDLHVARQGVTQTGKSTNVLLSIMTACLGNKPSRVKFLICDGSEKRDISGLFRHFMLPHIPKGGIATTREKTIQILREAVKIMTKRGKLREKAKGCQNIIELNKKLKKPQPLYVVVVTELQMLLDTNKKDAAELRRLLSLILSGGAADGVLLWADATAIYKATVGDIKVHNFSNRISFHNSAITAAFFGKSDTIGIDIEHLQRRGDAILVSAGVAPLRFQTIGMPFEQAKTLGQIIKTGVNYVG